MSYSPVIAALVSERVIICWMQLLSPCLEGSVYFSLTVLILRKRGIIHSHFADGETEVPRLTDQSYRGSHLEANNGSQIYRLFHLCVFNHKTIFLLFLSFSFFFFSCEWHCTWKETVKLDGVNIWPTLVLPHCGNLLLDIFSKRNVIFARRKMY